MSNHNVRIIGQFFNKVKRLKHVGSAVENNGGIVGMWVRVALILKG